MSRKTPRTEQEWEAWAAERVPPRFDDCKQLPSCGTLSGYRGGCRETPCRQANAGKVRRSRATNPPNPPATPTTNVVPIGAKAAKPKTTVSQPDSAAPGPVEQAVRGMFAQRDPDGDFAVQREQAIVLATVLDDPQYKPSWHQYSSKLDALTKCFEARKRKTKRGNALATVRRMSNARREA